MAEQSIFYSKEMVNSTHHISVEQKTFRGESGGHFHEFFEIELVLGGRGKQVLNGIEYELGRGSAYLLSPADFHNVVSDEGIELINLMFDETLITQALSERILGSHGALFVSMEEHRFLRCVSLAELMIWEVADGGSDAETCIRNLMECLMLALMRCDDVEADVRMPHGFAEVAMNYLYTHFRERLTVEEIAEVCGYTPNYFSRLFHSLTGRSYTDFLNALRVNHAIMLLRSTKQSVTEIAFGCGFSSLSNFYRAFREQTGRIPTEIRHSVSGRE